MKLFIVLIIASLFSCNNGRIVSENGNNLPQYHTIKEIPKDRKGNFNFYYLISRDIANQLKLGSLESGYDSLQVRIWYNYSRENIKKLVILKNKGNEWTCKIYNLTVDESDFNLKKQHLNNYQVIKKTPKSGWDKFINQILRLKILSLPNLESVKGFNDSFADGETYCFEIASKDKYRFYSYWSPHSIEDKYAEAKYALEILKLIDKELDFDGLKKD